jgi:excisionase family DNA binding protein
MGTSEINNFENHGVKKVQRISNPLPKRLYTLSEAAHYLGRTLWSMRELIWKGSLPIVRDGKRIFVDIKDLEFYVTKNKTTYI